MKCGPPISRCLLHQCHDDVIKWKYFPRYLPFVCVCVCGGGGGGGGGGIHRSPVYSPHKGQWPGASMFSLICAWINAWVSNRDFCNLRRYCSHYDVTVMANMANTSDMIVPTACFLYQASFIIATLDLYSLHSHCLITRCHEVSKPWDCWKYRNTLTHHHYCCNACRISGRPDNSKPIYEDFVARSRYHRQG